MNTATVLIDLANTDLLRGKALNPPLVSAEIDDFVGRLVDAWEVLTGGAPDTELRLRFYDGWLTEESRSVDAHVLVRAHLRSYPTLKKRLRVFARVAEGPLATRDRALPGTYRVKSGLPSNTLVWDDERPPSCTRPDACTLPLVRQWLQRGRCPERGDGCSVSLDRRRGGGTRLPPVVSHRQQKLVDTLLVADLVWLASQGEAVVVVSDDEDVIPGLLVAASYGTQVTWVCRDGRPRDIYGPTFSGVGVECLKC